MDGQMRLTKRKKNLSFIYSYIYGKKRRERCTKDENDNDDEK